MPQSSESDWPCRFGEIFRRFLFEEIDGSIHEFVQSIIHAT